MIFKAPCIVYLLFVSQHIVRAVVENERPIVGILTGKFFSSFIESIQSEIITPQIDVSSASEYLPASYVKVIESAGARVVPISFELSTGELIDIFSRVNGVVIPGGAGSLKRHYALAATTLWEHVEANPGYPVLGICLGFELIASLAAGDLRFIRYSGQFDAENLALNLHFTDQASTSQLFQYVYRDQELLSAMSSKNVTFHGHQKGVSPTVFYQYPTLYNRFNILATSYDRDGREFVSAFEGVGGFRNIFGVQFHPEKVLFEWNKHTKIPKSSKAIRANQAIINAFVQSTRLNKNVFVPDVMSESEYLVERYTKLLMKSSFYFTEIYLFFPERLPGRFPRVASG